MSDTRLTPIQRQAAAALVGLIADNMLLNYGDELDEDSREFYEAASALAKDVIASTKPLPAPGMTDLMVAPESIDKFLDENPPDA